MYSSTSLKKGKKGRRLKADSKEKATEKKNSKTKGRTRRGKAEATTRLFQGGSKITSAKAERGDSTGFSTGG